MARVHVTFGMSAGGSLRAALAALELRETVLPLGDDLSFGPINPGDARHRFQWAVDELEFPESPEQQEQVERFWRQVRRIDGEIVAWLSSRSASEYCGLLSLLWEVREVPISIVDVADVAFSDLDVPGARNAFSVIHHDHVVNHKLVVRARPLSELERARYVSEWRKLRAENAPLRVLTDQGLVSAPLDYFDATIRSCVTGGWQSCARVIATTLRKLSDEFYCQCMADELLFDRLIRLAEDAVIDGDRNGELWDFRESRVRLRPTS